MNSYEKFGKFYDLVMGDRKAHAKIVHGLLRKHCPQCSNLLELGCGSGSVLKYLKDHYDVTGLDLSKEMLKVARKKLPGIQLFQQDMTSFSLSTRFDAIICVFDSINHLTKWSDWKKVFLRAKAHLKDDGIFLFDINTVTKLKSFAASPPWVHHFNGHYLLMDVTCNKQALSKWNIKVFENNDHSRFTLHEEDIYEKSFPLQTIRTELQQRFHEVKVVDLKNKKITSKSEKLNFICKKGKIGAKRI